MRNNPRLLENKCHLSLHVLTEGVKLSHSIRAIAEKSHTDALPIASSHGEGLASWREMFTIGAKRELMTVCRAVIGDAQPELRIVSLTDNLPLAMSLDKYAFFAESDASEELARAAETGIAGA